MIRRNMSDGQWCYEFPRPAVTTDAVIFRPSRRAVLLVRRADEPFEGEWALPGGYVDQDEDLLASVRRELEEETGLVVDDLEQLRAYGTPGRDPRGHTVSIAFVGRDEGQEPEAADDAEEAKWWSVDDLPDLAFDHDVIISDAVEAVVALGWIEESP